MYDYDQDHDEVEEGDDKDHVKVEDGDDEDDDDVKEREGEQDELQSSNICSAEQQLCGAGNRMFRMLVMVNDESYANIDDDEDNDD